MSKRGKVQDRLKWKLPFKHQRRVVVQLSSTRVKLVHQPQTGKCKHDSWSLCLIDAIMSSEKGEE